MHNTCGSNSQFTVGSLRLQYARVQSHNLEECAME